MKTIETIKKEFVKTVNDTKNIILFLQDKLDEKESRNYSFHMSYQVWYSKALKFVEIFGKDRLSDFKSYYEIDPKRKSLGYGTYVIQDYNKGVVPNRVQYSNFNTKNETLTNVYNQYTILNAIYDRIDNVVLDIQTTLLDEIQETELKSARALLKINLRASGVIAGVILETHLGKVVENHNLKLAKKNPTLADYNEFLKTNNIYDATTLKKMIYLGDLRNICAHKKDKEPTMYQVEELIEGVNWAIKNLS